jgi:Domain of unknown function (DUF4185)
MIRLTVFVAFVALLLVGAVHAQPWYVEEAPEWTAMFDQHSGWTGADGIFSIPLNGDEGFGEHNERGSLFVFSDTFIGEVDGAGNRLPGTTMINNTMAFLPAGDPDPETIDFFYRQPGGNPASVFVPGTPNSEPGDYYWLCDGISLPDGVYILAWRMHSIDNWFYRMGISMLRIPHGSTYPWDDYQQWDVPLRVAATEDRGEISFGSGIMPNTVRAGAPHPDGYIYIYGLEEVPFGKHLLAARTPQNDFPYVDTWEFFDGTNWVQGAENAARLTDRVSSELSVTPLPNGQFICVFDVDTITRTVGFRIGATPRGPWTNTRAIYTSTVPDEFPIEGVWCYNAKAHPHLSEPGELLISYNVNCTDFWAHFSYADIYRPRFIRLVYTGNQF